MEQIEMEQLRQKLELQRLEIMHFLSRLDEEARSLDVDAAQDSVDQCISNMSKESLFERSSQRKTLLRLVEAAIRRIDDGSFGICFGCGDDIPDRRLRALPWTQFCLRCQEAIEEEVGATLSARAPLPTAGAWRRVG